MNKFNLKLGKVVLAKENTFNPKSEKCVLSKEHPTFLSPTTARDSPKAPPCDRFRDAVAPPARDHRHTDLARSLHALRVGTIVAWSCGYA